MTATETNLFALCFVTLQEVFRQAAAEWVYDAENVDPASPEGLALSALYEAGLIEARPTAVAPYNLVPSEKAHLLFELVHPTFFFPSGDAVYEATLFIAED